MAMAGTTLDNTSSDKKSDYPYTKNIIAPRKP
jgi:hypothetical protein